MVNLKIKKLNQNAVVPKYATDSAAGMDLTATSEKFFADGPVSYIEYGTGLSVEIPEGYVGLLFPRSSISSGTSLSLANSVGVIDSDYRGEIKFRFRNLMFGSGRKYNIGDRIGQLIILPYPKFEVEEVDELNDTDRGSGGFGSTNK